MSYKMFLYRYPIIILAIILAFSGVLVTSQLVNLTYAQDFSSPLYSPSDSPFGIPYGVWLAKYWDWWANVPKEQSPTQQNYQCYMYDAGDVVFLVNPLKMSSEVTYTCKIPSGKALFAALVTAEYDNGTEGYEKASDKQLMDAARQDDNSNAFKVMLDGKVIPSDYLRSLRAESPFWDITIVEGNHYDSPPGIFRAFAEGFSIFLKPLPPGSHQLYYETSSPKSDFQVSPGGKITYNLFVNSTKT